MAKLEETAVLRAVREARQVLAASCRNHLIRIENEAKTPKARKELAPHAEALQEALEALVKPVPEQSSRPAAWEIEPSKRLSLNDHLGLKQ